MTELIADSGSTKTQWAWKDGPLTQLVETCGLNPLYVQPAEITEALRSVLAQVPGRPDQLRFYGSGCSGERIALVEQALRGALSPMTRVTVDSDLRGAALALAGKAAAAEPFITCIMGTGAIAALYDPASQTLTPMPALGYVLGDEGSGAWFGRHLLSDYLKGQMPQRVREVWEDDFGMITPEQAIRHVYQLPCPNRYLATFAAFLGRHLDLRYCQELAYRGCDAFWRRNVMPIDKTEAGCGVADVRMVGSVAWGLQSVLERVAESHDYVLTAVIKEPIVGLIS